MGEGLVERLGVELRRALLHLMSELGAELCGPPGGLLTLVVDRASVEGLPPPRDAQGAGIAGDLFEVGALR